MSQFEIELEDMKKSIDLSQITQVQSLDRSVEDKLPKAKSTSTLCKILKLSINIGVWAMPSIFSQTHLAGGFLLLLITGLMQFYSWDILFTCLEEKTRYEKMIPLRTSNNYSRATTRQNQHFQRINSHISNFRSTINFEVDSDDEEDEVKEQKIIKYRPLTMINLVEELYPKIQWFPIIVKIATIFLLQGSAIGQVMIIKNVLTILFFFRQVLNSLEPELDRSQYKLLICFFLSIILFLCSKYQHLEQIKTLIYWATYITMMMVYLVFSLSLFQMKLNSQNSVEIVVEKGINWVKLPSYFAIVLFAYDINGQVTEVRKEMNHPDKYKKVLFAGMLIQFLIYGALGSVGYCAYGSQTKRLIMNNVYITVVNTGIGIKIVYQTLRTMFAFTLLVTLTTYNIVGIEQFQNIWVKFIPRIKSFKYHLPLISYTYIFIYIIIAAYLSDIIFLISLLGSVAIIFLGFILPYVLYLKCFPKIKKSKIALNTFVLILGVLGGFAELIYTFIN